MTDEQHELRRINWTEMFGFTHIFKSFKMAIHPSKLGLALAAVVIIFCCGWVMDQLWSVGDEYVYPGEIYDHFSKPSGQFGKDKDDRLERRLNLAAALVTEAEAQKYSLNTYKFQLARGPLHRCQDAGVGAASGGGRSSLRCWITKCTVCPKLSWRCATETYWVG